MIAAITMGVVLVLVIAVLVGVQLGQSVLTGAASRAVTTAPVSSSAAVPASTPTAAAEATESPKPEPAAVKAVPTESAPPHFERVTPTPVPEQSFAEVQPLPPQPRAEQPEALPDPPPTPTPEPTCPADKGVTLTITKAELVHEGGSDDEFKLTLELDNKIGVPVSFSPIDVISVTAVRATGEQMGAGNISLPETYEVPQGRRTFTTDATYHAATMHAFGSPVIAFKLGGEVWVENATSDQDTRVLYCEFKPMAYGKSLQGEWGS
jgi:hypothetical protein